MPVDVGSGKCIVKTDRGRFWSGRQAVAGYDPWSIRGAADRDRSVSGEVESRRMFCWLIGVPVDEPELGRQSNGFVSHRSAVRMGKSRTLGSHALDHDSRFVRQCGER
jgi:hypothetical protein